MSASNKRRSSRRCKRNSGQGKYEVIRISGNVRNDLQFIKGFVGIASNVPDGEVIEVSDQDVQTKKDRSTNRMVKITRYLWTVIL